MTEPNTSAIFSEETGTIKVTIGSRSQRFKKREVRHLAGRSDDELAKKPYTDLEIAALRCYGQQADLPRTAFLNGELRVLTKRDVERIESGELVFDPRDNPRE